MEKIIEITIDINEHDERACNKHCQYFSNNGFCDLFLTRLELDEETNLVFRDEECLQNAKIKES